MTDKQILGVKERIVCLAVILSVIGLVYFFTADYRRTIAYKRENFILKEKIHFADTKQRIELIFAIMYQNARIISLLPGVRNIQGGNLKEGEESAVDIGRFEEETKNTLQQIYNNLEENVNVSEVYCVIDGFSPAKGETPFFMYDELILRADTGFVGRQLIKNPDTPEEVEEEEYEWFETNIPVIKRYHPTFNFPTFHDIPAYISHEFRTCDNTQYISKSKGNVKDTYGLIMVIPFYNYAEQFRGVIAIIFRSNVIEAALLNRPFIPITEDGIKHASREGWSLPDEPGRFLLVNDELGISISDRRAQDLLSRYQSIVNDDKKIKADKQYIEESLTLPFAGEWKLFYPINNKGIETIRKSELIKAVTLNISIIVIGFSFAGWICHNAQMRKYALRALSDKVRLAKTKQKQAEELAEVERIPRYIVCRL